MNTQLSLSGMLPEAVETVRVLENFMLQLEQIDLYTDHVLHAGMYARTVRIPAGVIVTGALIKIPTLIIVQGRGRIFDGEKMIELNGYHVIPAGAGRKQVFVAHEDTFITMIFPTSETEVEDAENAFTDEPDRLMSRRHP